MITKTFPSIRKINRWVLTIIAITLVITSCSKTPIDASDNISAAMVLTWNKAAIDVVIRTQQAVPNPPIPPFVESRFLCNGEYCNA